MRERVPEPARRDAWYPGCRAAPSGSWRRARGSPDTAGQLGNERWRVGHRRAGCLWGFREDDNTQPGWSSGRVSLDDRRDHQAVHVAQVQVLLDKAGPSRVTEFGGLVQEPHRPVAVADQVETTRLIRLGQRLRG